MSTQQNKAELMYLEFGVLLQASQMNTGFNGYLSTTIAKKIGVKISLLLQEMYIDLPKSGVLFLGAGYQISQIMRPQFPIYHELVEVSKAHFRPKNFKPSIVTIAAKESKFSIGAFNIDTASSDAMFVFPALLVLPKTEANINLVTEIEETLSQKADITENLGELIEHDIQCRVAQIHFVTLGDITSFFATQLIQINLEPLWEVMKHIIFNMGAVLHGIGSGHLIYWSGKEVEFIVPSEEIYYKIFSNHQEDYERYKQTLKRLKLLMTDHGIQFSEHIIDDESFFAKQQTLESLYEYFDSHPKEDVK